MDPTDIVLVPFDRQRLAIYVGTVIVLNNIIVGFLLLDAPNTTSTPPPQYYLWSISSIFQKTANGLGSLLFSLGQATVVTWGVAILCGVPPTQTISQTFLACTYIADLMFLTTTTTTSSPTTTVKNSSLYNNSHPWWWCSWQLRILLLLPTTRNNDDDYQKWFEMQFLASCQTHATAFGVIPCSVLRLYDWGSQIQRWPLPLILGSTYGFVAGTVLGIGGIVLLRYNGGGGSSSSNTPIAAWYEDTVRGVGTDEDDNNSAKNDGIGLKRRDA
jgi:hypothetical protein